MILVVVDLLAFLPWISALFRRTTPLNIPLNYEKRTLNLNPEVFSRKFGYDFLTLNNSTDLIDWAEYEIKPSSELPIPDDKTTQQRILIPFHNHSCVYNDISVNYDQDEAPPSAEEIFTKLETLKNLPCLTYTDDYWKFEYCHLRKVKQSDTSSSRQPTVYNLGHFFPKDPKSKRFLFNNRVFALKYSSGDKCLPYAPKLYRTTQVRFTCDPKSSSILPEITSVFEVSLCNYVVSINVPSLCENALNLSKHVKIPHYTLFCGGLDEQHVKSQSIVKDEVFEKAHSLWIAKVGELLNSENPHKLLARALLDIHGDTNLLRAAHPRNTLNVFAIRNMQHRIEEAIRDLKRRPTDSRKEKKKFFITTFTEDNGDEENSKKERKRRKTFKIEL